MVAFNKIGLAKKELYLRYCPLAIKISTRYAKDDHEAKDIVQNAFIQILTKIDQFNPKKGSLEQWISGIVRNEALQLFRATKKIEYQDWDYSNNQPTIDPIILDRLKAEDVIRLLRKLPSGYRIVFVLSVIEGFNHKEIAEELGIVESASRSQLARAKKMLRAFIVKQNSLEHAK